MSNEFNGLNPLCSSLAGGVLSLLGSWGAVWFTARREAEWTSLRKVLNAVK